MPDDRAARDDLLRRNSATVRPWTQTEHL